MPIEIWKTPNGSWFWTCRATNGEIISDSAEVYSSRLKAINGANATAKEMVKWLDAQKKTPRKKPTSGRRKPAAKRSTLSSSRTRKTAKRDG